MTDTERSAASLILQPKHLWFSSEGLNCKTWFGPFRTVEGAALECYTNSGSEKIFIAQGRRLTKAQKKEWGGKFNWMVDNSKAFEIVILKRL